MRRPHCVLLLDAARAWLVSVPVSSAMVVSQLRRYPSFGYEINNVFEPATTVWELWNSDTTGPGMNSRK